MFGLKVPLPLELQVPVPVVDIPFRTTVALLEHTVWFVPAFTARVLTYTNVIEVVTGLQPPLFVEVIFSTTLPAVVSAVLDM